MHLCGAIDLQINSAYRSYGSIANAEIIRAQDLKSDYANRFSIDNNKKKAEKTKLEICCWHLFIYSRARTKSENNNFYDINKA